MKEEAISSMLAGTTDNSVVSSDNAIYFLPSCRGQL